MINRNEKEVWFVTGSQHLYGEETLKKVAENAGIIAAELNNSKAVPVSVIRKNTVTTPHEILSVCREANSSPSCIGLIFWMHTFSPAKMWIAGLTQLKKPFLHLHTQFNRDIPWNTIDMDFMNLNQSAHGGREFGFICSRMNIERTVISGHWKKPEVQKRVGIWVRAAAAWQDMQTGSIARFGDNMREVAVTEGDKVEAQLKLGFSCNGYALGDLAAAVEQVGDAAITELIEEYAELYAITENLLPGGSRHGELRSAAKIEAGMRGFLQTGGFTGFTTTFENLYGLNQLPGLACQRLMAEGYGFGAEGDWKTAALVRAMKVMSDGLPGGTSFMEDYTYHLDPENSLCLGAHMLEVCPSIANPRIKPSLEIHPLGIGGKADPARLVFTTQPGPALNASIMDMGGRFRLLVNTVDVVNPGEDLPNLPVARVVWKPHPNLETASAAWIYGGGAHHAGFSKALNTEFLENFASMAGIECVVIDQQTRIRDLKNELRWNSTVY
ncbi:MAG: L-arabinose isomerase [Bacteroidetes bacterium]|nr:L-arabinose isomerase [Bacteroidota bacterium]